MLLSRLALDRPVLPLPLSPAASLVDPLRHGLQVPLQTPSARFALCLGSMGPVRYGRVSGWLDLGASWYSVLFFGTYPLNGFVEREFPWTGPVCRRLHDGCIMSWPG